MLSKNVFYLPIVIEINDDGYLASSPDIQGAFAEGDTIEEAIFNCVDVVKMIAAYRAERGETLSINQISLPASTPLSFAMPIGMV